MLKGFCVDIPDVCTRGLSNRANGSGSWWRSKTTNLPYRFLAGNHAPDTLDNLSILNFKRFFILRRSLVGMNRRAHHVGARVFTDGGNP